MIAAAAVLAICFMAPQLLPGLELQRLGPRRTGGLSVAQQLVLGEVWPRLLVARAVDSTTGRPHPLYFGVVALLVMPLSLFWTERRALVAFLWLLFAFATCAALTRHTPVFALYDALGGSCFVRRRGCSSSTRSRVRCGCARIRSPRALDERTPRSGQTRRSAADVPPVATTFTIAIVAVTPVPARGIAIIGAALALIWGASVMPATMVQPTILVALATVVAVELFSSSYNQYFHPWHDPTVFDREHVTFDWIKAHQGLDRTYIKGAFDVPQLMAKDGSLYGIYSITNYEPLTLSRYERFFHSIEASSRQGALKAPFAEQGTSVPFTGTLSADPRRPEFRLLDLLSTRFMVVSKSDFVSRFALAAPGSAWHVAFSPRDGATAVYENAGALPRAYVAHEAITAQSDTIALGLVMQRDFAAGSSVVLEALEPPILQPQSSPSASITPARITEYLPASATIETNDERPGYLVLTDTNYPGWTATVDGVPVRILAANYLFRAVPVGAGAHSVRFVYEPASFRRGMELAVGGIIASALALLLDIARRRRSTPHVRESR